MRLTYDPDANAAYIRLRETQGDVDDSFDASAI